jgi:hypothetical protein
MVQRYGEYTYRQGEMRGIVGKEGIGRETDGVMFYINLTSELLTMRQSSLRYAGCHCPFYH